MLAAKGLVAAGMVDVALVCLRREAARAALQAAGPLAEQGIDMLQKEVHIMARCTGGTSHSLRRAASVPAKSRSIRCSLGDLCAQRSRHGSALCQDPRKRQHLQKHAEGVTAADMVAELMLKPKPTL